MRVLAIDFGMRRMGLAMSDPLGITAQGLETLQCTGAEKDLEKLSCLAAEHEVRHIIVGHPIHMQGGPTAMSERAEKFADDLRRHTSCPVELWDERLTTAEAEVSLQATGAGRSKRRQLVDRVAAMLLLQSYLDRQSLQSRGPQRETP